VFVSEAKLSATLQSGFSLGGVDLYGYSFDLFLLNAQQLTLMLFFFL
jgi:hypothetical protein